MLTNITILVLKFLAAAEHSDRFLLIVVAVLRNSVTRDRQKYQANDRNLFCDFNRLTNRNVLFQYVSGRY